MKDINLLESHNIFRDGVCERGEVDDKAVISHRVAGQPPIERPTV